MLNITLSFTLQWYSSYWKVYKGTFSNFLTSYHLKVPGLLHSLPWVTRLPKMQGATQYLHNIPHAQRLLIRPRAVLHPHRVAAPVLAWRFLASPVQNWKGEACLPSHCNLQTHRPQTTLYHTGFHVIFYSLCLQAQLRVWLTGEGKTAQSQCLMCPSL